MVSATSSLCPIGIQTGILQLTGPITPTILQSDSVLVNAPPFTASFAPRTVAPELIGSFIEDDPNNTILYKGIRYSLTAPVQICAPVHIGYKLPGQSQNYPQMELIVPFINTQVIGTYPAAVFCIFPIYGNEGGTEDGNAPYVQQLLTPETSPAAALQTLFYKNKDDKSQVCLSYATCFDLVGENQAQAQASVNCRFFVFPNGINLKATDATILSTRISQNNILPLFALPPGLIGYGMETVVEIQFDAEGNKQVVATSSQGNVPISTISVVSEEFVHKIQFFSHPPQLTADFNTKTCPYYRTTEYKCVPFDQLRDLSGNTVMPSGVSLDKVLQNTNEATSVTTTSSFNTEDMWEAIVIVVSVLGGLWLFTWIGGMLLRWLQADPGSIPVAVATSPNTGIATGTATGVATGVATGIATGIATGTPVK
jgi:hypothetical protein